MRQGDLSITSSALHYALKALRQRWDDTQQGWNDSVRRAFEEKHLAPLDPQVLAALKAINRLSMVMSRAYDECS